MADPIIDISDDELIDVSGDELVQAPQQKPQTAPGGPSSMGIYALSPSDAQSSGIPKTVLGWAQNASGGLAQSAVNDIYNLGKHFGIVDEYSVPKQQFEWAGEEMSTGGKVVSALSGGLAMPSGAGILATAGRFGKLGTAAAGAAQGALVGGAQAYDLGQDPAHGAVIGGVLGGAVPLVAGGLFNFAGFLKNKISGSAFEMVHDMAQKILNRNGAIKPQVMEQLVKTGTSKMGFQNRMDDLLYIVTNKLDPRITESANQTIAKMGKILGKAQQDYSALRQPVRNIEVPTEQLVGKLQGMATNLSQGRYKPSGNIDPMVTRGPDAAKIIRNDVIPQYEGAVAATRPTFVSIGEQSVLPQQIPAFNVPEGQAPWAPESIDPAWGQFSPSANIPNPTVKQAKKANAALDPADYQFIVPQDKKATHAQAPAWLTGQDVNPQQPNPASWSAFDSIPQTQVNESMMIPPASQESTVPLSNLDRMRAQIRSEQFKPAYQVSDPKAAQQQASRGMEEVFLGYATPQQRAAIEAGKVPYQQVKDTSEIFHANWSGAAVDSTGHGLSQTVKGSVMNRAFNNIGSKMNIVKYNAAQAVAAKALRRINRMTGAGIKQQTAPFQLQNIKAQLQQIGQMNQKDASVFAYAAAMTNPAFRKVWMEAQEDNNE